jgi:hypothetical protein
MQSKRSEFNQTETTHERTGHKCYEKYLNTVPDFVELEKCQHIIRAAGCIQPVTYKI